MLHVHWHRQYWAKAPGSTIARTVAICRCGHVKHAHGLYITPQGPSYAIIDRPSRRKL